MGNLLKNFSLKNFINNKKFQYILVCVLAVVVVLIFVLSFMPNSQVKSDEIGVVDEYVKSLESRLSNTLSQVKDAGKVSVVITVESGMETVLAMKTTTKENGSIIETETSPILVNGKTVVIKEKYPNIVGVLIVCQGANNITVLSKIQQATVSLLNINLNQIEILAMK